MKIDAKMPAHVDLTFHHNPSQPIRRWVELSSTECTLNPPLLLVTHRRENCGRNVSFHSDFVQFNLRLLVIHTAKGRESDTLDFGAKQSRYKFLDDKKSTKVSLDIKQPY